MRLPALATIAATLLIAASGYLYWNSRMTARTPDGLAAANGRIEVERVDIAAKLSGASPKSG